MRGRKGTRRPPEAIGLVIPRVLKRAKQRRGPLVSIQRSWSRLVGKALAEHTRPVGLQRGRLIVCAELPGDGFALRYERARLLGRLQAATKGKVEDIVIRPGDPRET